MKVYETNRIADRRSRQNENQQNSKDDRQKEDCKDFDEIHKELCSECS